MKRRTLTLRLDDELDRELDRLARQTGRTRSDLARDALRRQLSLLRFERLRNEVLPFAEARGIVKTPGKGRNGRGADVVARLRGTADVKMTTDQILALTRRA